MDGKLRVALTVDADNDFDAHPAESAEPVWSGVERGIPALLDQLEAFRARRGIAVRATWFVRADPHVAGAGGDFGRMLDEHKSLWTDRKAAGDEIAVHPHLYWRDAGGWSLRDDAESLRGALLSAAQAFRSRGHEPRTIRIGESFMNRALLEAIESLGFAADATAMPGKIRLDPPWRIDWEGCPGAPFAPSRADHRRPVRPGEESYPFVELPMTMVAIRAPYDDSPRSRYVNCAFHPEH